MARKREYTIYATARRGKFSVKSYDYSAGTHRWTYTVYAESIKEAYGLAAREEFARDCKSGGVRRIEYDWWHTSHTPASAQEAGLVVVAPYLPVWEKGSLEEASLLYSGQTN